jgi:acetyl-CoA acetyltransferase
MQGKAIRIVGVGMTPLGRLGKDSATLATEAIHLALKSAEMSLGDLHGLVAVPSLSNPHFMQAHYLATVSGLNRINKKLVVRTIDTGGAGPISAIATAANMIRTEWAETVAIVASDSVLSLPSKDFASRADASVEGADLPSPRIPHGYDTYAQWHMKAYGLTRRQLAMVPVLMSAMATRHPDALCREPYSLEEVLNSRQIAPVTGLLECARRSDGAVALIVSSERHYKRNFGRKLDHTSPAIVGVGEASGPLYPPPNPEDISPADFSCERAAKLAYRSAQLGPKDINFFGLYDCFPICFIRALEAVGVCGEGEGGQYVESAYNDMLQNGGKLDVNRFPINTHGGLQCFGAPWEVPAMYNVVEAIAQLSGNAGERQIFPKPKRALVYGNGGIFSASSVAILGDGVY